MRALAILIGSLILTLAANQVAAQEDRSPAQTHTCKIKTGYVTAIGRGSSALAALEEARVQCGTAMIEHYVSERGSISADVEDELVLSCVNLSCE